MIVSTTADPTPMLSVANEAYRPTNRSSRKIGTTIAPASGLSASKAPAPVLPPAPPLKFRNTDQLWPAIAAGASQRGGGLVVEQRACRQYDDRPFEEIQNAG